MNHSNNINSMDNGVELWIWIASGLLTFISGIGAWVFNKLNNRVELLEGDVSALKTTQALNAQADQYRHRLVMEKLEYITKEIEKVDKRLEVYDRGMTNLFAENPDITRPKS